VSERALRREVRAAVRNMRRMSSTGRSASGLRESVVVAVSMVLLLDGLWSLVREVSRLGCRWRGEERGMTYELVVVQGKVKEIKAASR
jgi:hypothetical protein